VAETPLLGAVAGYKVIDHKSNEVITRGTGVNTLIRDIKRTEKAANKSYLQISVQLLIVGAPEETTEKQFSSL
jgi:hypothetical protein